MKHKQLPHQYLTAEEYATLVVLYNRLRVYALELPYPKDISRYDYFYPHGISGITETGITLYDMVERRYDTGYEIEDREVKLEDVLNPKAAIAREKAEYEAQARARAKSREEYDRSNYERLKAKYGVKDDYSTNPRRT